MTIGNETNRCLDLDKFIIIQMKSIQKEKSTKTNFVKSIKVHLRALNPSFEFEVEVYVDEKFQRK